MRKMRVRKVRRTKVETARPHSETGLCGLKRAVAVPIWAW